MKITQNQIAILNSFHVTRLKEDDSLLRDVASFVEKIRSFTGCEYLYLFAADATSDRHLVNHYKNMMGLREEMTMSALQPIYDFNCSFLCADIDSLLNARDEFYNDFNIVEDFV